MSSPKIALQQVLYGLHLTAPAVRFFQDGSLHKTCTRMMRVLDSLMEESEPTQPNDCRLFADRLIFLPL